MEIKFELANGMHVLKGKTISSKTVTEAKAFVGEYDKIVKTASDRIMFVKGDLVIATLMASKLGARLNMYNKGL